MCRSIAESQLCVWSLYSFLLLAAITGAHRDYGWHDRDPLCLTHSSLELMYFVPMPQNQMGGFWGIVTSQVF